MTVAATLTSVQYTGNGSATQFSFNNKIFQASDLIVTLFDTNGIEYDFPNQANVALGLSYTVQNVDVDSGCLVVFNTPPTLGWTVDLRTQTPETQSTSIKNQGAFLPELHEEAFDRLTREIQDLRRLAYTFGIHGPDNEATPWPALPNAAARANTNPGFDANGLPTLSVPLQSAMTQATFNAMLAAAAPPPVFYPQTIPETTAGVTVVNFSYPPYAVDRYANNANPGITDMWQAIFNADMAANLAGARVQFAPGSVYGVNCTAHTAALTISSSWVCGGPQATIRRIDFTASTQYYTAFASQVAHLSMRNLIFDGQVTTVVAGSTPNVDLGASGSYGDNATESLWTQVLGVIFRQTQFCTVEDCVFKNFLRAGLRFDSTVGGGPTASGPPWVLFAGGGQAQSGSGTSSISLGNRIVNCRAQRTRGIFGDSFYAQDVETIQFANCYGYDYQRIAFVNEFGTLGTNGAEYVNCTADFGHDAVTSGAQSNVGFWSEAVDGLAMVNCESKNTSVGWVMNSPANPSQGVYRPYTGHIALTNCKAIRCNSSGFKIGAGQRDVNYVFQGCFVEVNSTAATYSASVGVGANGFQISWSPSAGGPNGTANTAGNFQLLNCGVDMVAMSGTPTASAVNMWQGSVTNSQQLQVTIQNLRTKWLTSAGANDAGAVTSYESTTAPNFGYFGDIVFTGANNGGAQFQGRAKILNCANDTGGTVLVSSEINSQNSLLEISNTRVSLRTGGATSNQGILNLRDCSIVDYRGNPQFNYVWASGCFFADMDGAHTDRTSWGSSSVNGTEFYFTGCRFQRRMMLTMGSGTTTNRGITASFSGCEWYMQFPYGGGGEAGLTLALGGGAFGTMNLSGCTFRNVGGQASATGAMIVNNSTGTLQINGAGNAYDDNYVVTGGHVIQYNSTPTFNDSPQTAAAPFQTVNGVRQQYAAA